MRKVLFLAKHLDSGGVTTHMMALGRGLQERGWEIAIASGGIYGRHDHGPDWFESNGIPHFSVPFPGMGAPVRNVLRAASSLVRSLSVFRRFRPDIVHVHWRVASTHARLAKSLWKIPFVVTLNQHPIPSGPIMRRLSQWGDLTIAVSREAADHLIRGFGVPPDRIRVIHNCVDDKTFRPPTAGDRQSARHRLGLSPVERTVCLVGRLERVKGHDVLVEALCRLRQSGMDVVALCAGEGSQESAIRVDAHRQGVGDLVRLLGFLPSREVLWATEICVLPSRAEGFPVSVAEAMMCGVVPIRTPAAGASDQIKDGVDGFVVPFNDSTALAARIKQLLGNDELRQQMGTAALRTARERFTAATMTSQVIDVYESCIGRESSPRT